MIKLGKILNESSGISGDSGSSVPSGNNSSRWTPTGQKRKVRIEQLSVYEQIDFPSADSVDISNEKYNWISQSNTAKYNNKVRAVRDSNGTLKLETKMKLTKQQLKDIIREEIQSLNESKGIFKHRIKLYPYEFYKLSDNYKKLNKDNKVIEDKRAMKDIDSIDPVYVGYNSKTKEMHWRWIEDDMELHIDSGKSVPLVWDLIKRFDRTKEGHQWGQ
jgi:hypothetical protein